MPLIATSIQQNIILFSPKSIFMQWFFENITIWFAHFFDVTVVSMALTWNRMINWFIINETPTRSIRWKHSFFISVYLSSLLSDDVDCVLCLESLVTMPNKTHDFSFSKFTRWISSWLVFRHIHSISNSAGFFIAPIDFNSFFFPGDVINLIVISFDMEMKEYIQF